MESNAQMIERNLASRLSSLHSVGENTLLVSSLQKRCSLRILIIPICILTLSSMLGNIQLEVFAITISCSAAVPCIGTDNNDKIIGSTGDDDIDGKGGNDTITGSDGLDIISGGNGTDEIVGGKGNDKIYGADGNDNLDGNEGNDELSGGLGNDLIAGESGYDVIEGLEGSDRLFGGPDQDHIVSDRLDGNDFDPDFINCGSGGNQGGGDKIYMSSSGGDYQIYCEVVIDYDQ
jgi:Ca2+-binding RTX toxin-like protein